MKANPLVELLFAGLVIFHFFSCSAQGDPLDNWTLVWPANSFFDNASGIAYGNDALVAVGPGQRAVSSDGVNWAAYISPPIIGGGITVVSTNGSVTTYPASPVGIAFGGGLFATFGTSAEDNANYIITSSNGLAWTPVFMVSNVIPNSISDAVFAAAYGNNKWVFLASYELITASVTSSNWNWTQFHSGGLSDGSGFSPASIAYGNGRFAITTSGYYSSVLSSTDGVTWKFDSLCPYGTQTT